MSSRRSRRSLSTGTRSRWRSGDFGKLQVECLEHRLLLAGDGLTGNGAPSGEHYNLNIIGTSEKNMDGDNSSGHVIFVPNVGKAKISLSEGDDFAVLDKNGTDKDGAAFQLPDPGLDPYEVDKVNGADTVADYSVFARPLGKPGGYSTLTTCADVVEGELATFLSAKEIRILQEVAEFGGYCSVEQVGQEITFREKGKSEFTDVTAELLTVVFEVEFDSDGDGIVDGETTVRIPIFDGILENEYWEYDNNGLRLLQLRFYPMETDLLDSGNALHVAGNPGAVLVGQQLTQGMLAQATQQAVALWASEHGAAELAGVDVRIGQLNGTMLGYATRDTIWIDNNAAGYGWSVSRGVGVDLVDALEHEFGHVLGFDHDHGGVMESTLAAGLAAPALAPTNISVADFLLPADTQQRDALFGELGQSHDFDALDVRLGSYDVLPVAQDFGRLNRLSKRVDSDTLEEELESLEEVLEDVDAA